MYAVMKALRQVKFNGMLVPDHIPQLVGDSGMRRAGTACDRGVRALLRRSRLRGGLELGNCGGAIEKGNEPCENW
jgi:hypothetical protein